MASETSSRITPSPARSRIKRWTLPTLHFSLLMTLRLSHSFNPHSHYVYKAIFSCHVLHLSPATHVVPSQVNTLYLIAHACKSRTLVVDSCLHNTHFRWSVREYSMLQFIWMNSSYGKRKGSGVRIIISNRDQSSCQSHDNSGKHE